MQSCDTLAITKEGTCYNKNLFGKNSDRPIGEAQPLVFVPGEKYSHGTKKKCTYIEIDEVQETYSVLGSKPFWIWGFEMGVNEHGLVIGNEAQGSRCGNESQDGLLGMDLLRLALERAINAKEAIDVITSLLSKYGQSGNASLLVERKYENSYILMDKEEIWILETAGREWAAKKVKTCAAISNCYSIRDDFDLCSTNLKQKAYEENWCLPSDNFDFAKAYSLPAVRQAFSTPRYQQMMSLLSLIDKHDFSSIKNIMRDHFENTIFAPRFGVTAGVSYTVCMHPQTKDDSKTAASLLVTYDDVLGLSIRHAFVTPCMSIYMPVYFTGYLPNSMQVGSGEFDANSMWWQVERVNVIISTDELKYKEKALSLKNIEIEIEEETLVIENNAKSLILKGKLQEANDILNQHMDYCSEKIISECKKIFEDVFLDNTNCFCGTCKELNEWYNNKTKILAGNIKNS